MSPNSSQMLFNLANAASVNFGVSLAAHVVPPRRWKPALYDGPVSVPSRTVAAILLSGGASRRMGQDKSQLIVNGRTLAVRTAALLSNVVTLAIEVGPGVSGLPSTLEAPPRSGPLVAIAQGCSVLHHLGHTGDALVVACDLPFLSEELLRLLAEWDAAGSVVPVVGGRPQPLCGRWSGRDLSNAGVLVGRGVRSLHYLSSEPDVNLIDESHWGHVASEETFSDVDSPADLERLGLTMLVAPNVPDPVPSQDHPTVD